MGGREHAVVGLREVALPAYAPDGSEWMSLPDAEAAGIDLSRTRDGIGPRVRGMVYRSGYWGHVSTVHGVFVQVVPADRDPVSGKFRPRRAVHWEVAEESADDHGRVRRHCTSWAYDRRNQPLVTIGE